MIMEIQIWNDFCVPHCYTGEVLLSKAIEELGLSNKVSLKLRAFELDPDFPKGKIIDIPTCVARKYGCSMAEGLKKIEYAAQLGREAGIDIRFRSAVFCNTRDAHRLLKFSQIEHGDNKAWQLNMALLHAYFTENKILDVPTLVGIAHEVGLPSDKSLEVLRTGAYLTEVLADEELAYRHGIHSIPCFVFDNKYKAGAQCLSTASNKPSRT